MLLQRGRLYFLCLALSPAIAAAQAYPAKPVRFVAPYPAGGVNDIVARIIGQRMSQTLGQQWVIDNRPGRGGNIGTEHVAKSAPDGYTLVHGGMGSLTSSRARCRSASRRSRRCCRTSRRGGFARSR